MISYEEVMKLTRNVSSATAFSDAECAALYDLCTQLNSSSCVVEIGSQLGRTSSIIAQVGKVIGYQSIHIDPYTFQYEYLAPWVKTMHEIGNPFTLHCMRSDQVRISRPIDLLLIDGDHTPAGVTTDMLFAGEHVAFGGIMCAHDYGQPSLPEVSQVLNKMAIRPLWQRLGVYDTLGVWRKC
jgi:hypothetical protein